MPTSGQGFPSGALVGGTISRNPLLQDYVFNAGLVKPEHSSWLVEKYNQYTLTVLTDRMGAWEPIMNDTLSWSVLDRTRKSATLSSGFTNGVASDTYTLDITAATANLGYFLVGDVVRTESGVLLKVTAVGDAGGFQTITVSKFDGSNIVTGDTADGEKLGHAFNVHAQASNGPAGRVYLPTEEYNYTQILKSGTKVGRDMLSNKIWLDVAGGQSWYWENEQIMFDEHFRDIENTIMFGTRSSSGSTKTTRGIWDRVVTAGEGQVINYASGTGITESNIQSLIERLVREGSSSELLVLCGSTAFSQIQQALKSYAVNGGIDYGAFGGNAVGLDIMTYQFFGKKLNFVHYALFDDDKMLPFVSTPTSTKVNFRNVALFLDMGSTSKGEKLLKLYYRDGDAGQAKLIHKVIPGMVGIGGANTSDTGGIAANSFDGFEVQVLTEMLVKFSLPNRSGALIANS
jgi:hypothetical protein